MKVMLDSNVFDRLAEDEESLGELENRRDILVLVSAVQRRELEAIPDESKRAALLTILDRLAGSVRADESLGHADGSILKAAAGSCDILVSDDIHMHEPAQAQTAEAGASKDGGKALRVMDYDGFCDRVLWQKRRGRAKR